MKCTSATDQQTQRTTADHYVGADAVLALVRLLARQAAREVQNAAVDAPSSNKAPSESKDV
jgi:hypothetical protein